MSKKEEVISFFARRWIEIDVISEFKKLERIGSVPINQLRDRDRLLREVNEAAENASRAETIYLMAREMYDRHMVGHHRSLGKLERKAIVRLKAWLKKHGVAASQKQITQDMVVKFICSKRDTREKYEKLVEWEIEVRRVRDNCKKLSDKWDARRWTLGTQAKLLEGIMEVDFGGGDRKVKRRRS